MPYRYIVFAFQTSKAPQTTICHPTYIHPIALYDRVRPHELMQRLPQL